MLEMPPSLLAPKPMGRRGAACCRLPVFCARCDLARAERASRCEHGLAQPHTCPQAMLPTCCSVSPTVGRWGWPCHDPLPATGCPAARVPSAPGPCCPTLSWTPGASGHRGTEVAICRFCCTGAARAWLSPLGSGPSGVVLILLSIAHLRPSPWPLAACPHGPVFQGTGQAAHSHLDRAAPALPCPHCPWARMSLLPSLWGLKC